MASPCLFPWNSASRRKPPRERELIPPRPKKKRVELTEDERESVQAEIRDLKEENEKLRTELSRAAEEHRRKIGPQKEGHIERFGLQRFQGSDSDIRFYTSLPSYVILLAIFNYLKPLLSMLYHNDNQTLRTYTPCLRSLQPIDEFFLVLVRLRLGLFERDVADRFSISTATVSRIFNSWIVFLSHQLRPLIIWPSRQVIQQHMPSQFKKLYPSARCIIDCTEIFCQTPSSMPLQSATYSSYKHHNTFKGLVAISPNGGVIFVSKLFAGSVSDKEITRSSGLLDLLEPGDSVLVDKGFDITYDCMVRGAKLLIPPFLCKNTQLSKKKVIVTRKIAHLRIHVERAIGRIKLFNILTHVVPLTLIPHFEHVWGACCALTLFHPPLVSSDE